MIFIGDRLTSVGLKLAGIKKSYIADKSNLGPSIRKSASDEDIILISAGLRESAGKIIDELRDNGKIVITIPDGSGTPVTDMDDLIKKAVGFEYKK